MLNPRARVTPPPGSALYSPVISLSSEDFPAPFGPIRPIFWLSWISQVRLRKIALAPKTRLTFENWIAIMAECSEME